MATTVADLKILMDGKGVNHLSTVLISAVRHIQVYTADAVHSPGEKG